MNRNYFTEPTLIFMVTIVVLFLLGATMSIMAMTDFFTMSPFTSQNRILLAIQLAGFLTTIKVIWNYFKNTRTS